MVVGVTWKLTNVFWGNKKNPLAIKVLIDPDLFLDLCQTPDVLKLCFNPLCPQVMGLSTPGKAEITSLDTGNIEEILSKSL